ncbi:M14 family metallopeptidase [Hydrogenimonas urashimensis]|uniref:M14 family metallopeptidase n=1 Tax=Hydrogenimonas urashimensis TaxID=2740515 RepID=UPI0019166F0D|nr:M14 family metallopeptidase [Hydrogenimonas urashimensis]
MIPLIELTSVPEGLLEIKEARNLHTVLPHPTLLTLEGHHKEALFVTVLLHGNEDTGLFAIQKILKKYRNRPLPRSLVVFFGNVYAAKEGLRRLDGQPDYNRVWPEGEEPQSDEAHLIERVVRRVTGKPLFASIDIHNNTGKNPHYGCINRLESDFLYLASLFSRIIVYFETPKGVQSMALAKYCPAITIECGKPHVSRGIEHAAEFVDSLLHLSAFPHRGPHTKEVEVFHTVARVTIPERFSFGFADADTDIRLPEELEEDNFKELPAGTPFGWVRPGSGARFEVFDDAGRECFDDFFTMEKNEIRLAKRMMPAMITRDLKIIRQDCLCYLMERYAMPQL